MRKLILLLILAVGLLFVGSMPAGAQQFTLGNSSQNVTFVGEGTNTLDLILGNCVAGVCTLSGPGLTPDGEAGTWSLIITQGSDNPDFGPNNGQGVFPLSSLDGTTAVFTFTDTTDGDSTVSVAVTLVDVADGSRNPHIDFITSLGSVLGEIILSPITCAGLPGGTSCNIDNVALNSGATASGTVSSGEVVITPEPASILLFGSGLMSAGIALRRRLKRARA